ncbi:MAG TPA: DUF4328 domain-containing protein [Polyangiaceae bacterium LLY-WYZ-15_(1-7)]|nr:DUF4328 domain-containing protein [Polyangiaceae bacterium LLY-WYZ-15_(1-7)]HJL09048.1 DUF4328 domain-containing protein [Polyangiaceae bacterium LLY-WYZ-15_(1-7)]
MPTYRGQRTADALVVFLWLTALAGVAVLAYLGADLVSMLSSGAPFLEGDSSVSRYLTVIGAYLGFGVAHFVTAVLFLTWFYRAHAAVRALPGATLRTSPGMSVLWWFVPLANLWVPLSMTKALWQNAEPDPGARPSATAPGFLSTWWTLWIMSWLFARASAFAPETVERAVQSLFADIASTATLLGAAFWAMRVVRALDERISEACAGASRPRAEALPAAPPVEARAA